MARVTVEDCILKIPNRFELVLLASQRARDITAGGSLTVERDNDKNPVVALREIADESIPLDNLQNALIKGMQKHVEIDEPEADPEFAAEGVWPADLASAPGMGEDGGAEEVVADEEASEDELFADGDAAVDAEAGDLDELPSDGALDEEP